MAENQITFLSYAKEDKQSVIEYYEKLKSDGFNPWLDERCILPGQEWDIVIRDTIKDARIFIVFLSEASLKKRGYIQREIRLALDAAEEIPPQELFIIPVRLQPCEIPDRLAKWQTADLYEPDGYKRLKASLAGATSWINLYEKAATYPEKPLGFSSEACFLFNETVALCFKLRTSTLGSEHIFLSSLDHFQPLTSLMRSEAVNISNVKYTIQRMIWNMTEDEQSKVSKSFSGSIKQAATIAQHTRSNVVEWEHVLMAAITARGTILAEILDLVHVPVEALHNGLHDYHYAKKVQDLKDKADSFRLLVSSYVDIFVYFDGYGIHWVEHVLRNEGRELVENMSADVLLGLASFYSRCFLEQFDGRLDFSGVLPRIIINNMAHETFLVAKEFINSSDHGILVGFYINTAKWLGMQEDDLLQFGDPYKLQRPGRRSMFSFIRFPKRVLERCLNIHAQHSESDSLIRAILVENNMWHQDSSVEQQLNVWQHSNQYKKSTMEIDLSGSWIMKQDTENGMISAIVELRQSGTLIEGKILISMLENKISSKTEQVILGTVMESDIEIWRESIRLIEGKTSRDLASRWLGTLEDSNVIVGWSIDEAGKCADFRMDRSVSGFAT